MNTVAELIPQAILLAALLGVASFITFCLGAM